MGGLGLTSIEEVTEISYAKKGIYLLKHKNLEKCRERYQVLQKAGWRNPLTDMEWVLKKYDVDIPLEDDQEMLPTRVGNTKDQNDATTARAMVPKYALWQSCDSRSQENL